MIQTVIFIRYIFIFILISNKILNENSRTEFWITWPMRLPMIIYFIIENVLWKKSFILKGYSFFYWICKSIFLKQLNPLNNQLISINYSSSLYKNYTLRNQQFITAKPYNPFALHSLTYNNNNVWGWKHFHLRTEGSIFFTTPPN